MNHQKHCGEWRGFWTTALLLVVVALGPLAEAAEKKINVAYSSISGNMAPLWVSHEHGFFLKYGLETQLILAEGGSRAAQMLGSGEVLFAQMAGPGVIQAVLRGADAVMIAGVVNTLTFQFIVQKGITQPDQLKGKSLAVTRYGSSTDFATRYVLDKYGLKPNSDVVISQLGTMPALYSALEAGKIQGALLSAPFTLQARKAGFRLLADLRILGLEYQHTGIATTRALIKSQPDLVRNFMRAYVEGIHYYKTHREESLGILQQYLKVNDRDALSEIYDEIGLILVPESPYPTVKGIHTILQELGANDPAAAAARAEQFVESRFVQELDRSGFIDQLYKSAPLLESRTQPRSAFSDPATTPSTAEENPKATAKASTLAERKAKVAPTPVAVRPAQSSAPLSDPPSAIEEYTIKAGDTLSKLGEKYYGSQWEWEKIYRANRQTIKNPNNLLIGQKITIPRTGDRPGR
jgi:ABC-type nitrate/sulfonate/bicarbonate transport system substrate-binding protein/LysM repeat protein